MFNLTDIVSLSKRALVKYNHTIANFFSENVALNVWSDGGEWPRYQQKYDNMFSYIHKLVPRSVNYVECITNAAVISHIQFCRQSSILCGMYVPYNRRFKISMLRHLVDNSPDHKITLIVKSSSLAYYISTILAEHDANAFLKNTHRQSLAASVEILSPAMVLENYLANHKQKYETLVLYDADTVTATYGLFSKILPYISTFPVYVTTLESDMHEACESVAQGAIECPHDNVPMLCLSRADDPESLSANIVVDLPIEGTQRVCVMHKRSVPIIGPDNRFTLLSRNATIEEKTKVAYWTLANGYHLVKKSCVSNPQIEKEKDDAPYDRFDYYASLLWAIEVVTGVTSGNVVQARQIWEAVGVYSPIVIDPISMHMDGATYINLLSCFKHWYNTEGITWKLYYYSSILHTTFTYEQIVFIHDGTAVTIRVGYVFKVGQSATCRIMVQSSTQLVQQQQIINKPHRLILSQYNLSRIGQSYVGLDMRVGATAIYTRACSQFERPSAMWRVICSVLPMERYIEIQSIIIMWNNILTKIGKPYNINVVVDEFISEFVSSIK